jgi:uncharacterized membrane protein
MFGYRGLIGVSLASIAAWLVLGTAVDSWTSTLRLFPFQQPIPALLVLVFTPILAALAALCLVAEISRIRKASPDGEQDQGPWRGAALTHALAPLAAIALIGTAVLLSRAAPTGARAGSIIFLLGAAGLIALLALIAELASGKGVDVESHWGGLGGALGGWSISSPVVMVLLLLASLGGMVAIGTGDDVRNKQDGNNAATDSQSATDGNLHAATNTAAASTNGQDANASNSSADENASASGHATPANAPRVPVHDAGRGAVTSNVQLNE